MKKPKTEMYDRKEKYSIEEVLDKVQFVSEKIGDKNPVDFNGDLINMASQRYQLFSQKGCTCVCCGLKGVFFAKERQKGVTHGRYHFNLYGLSNGEEILFTKDHIIPKCNGGKNKLENYQTMCVNCNNFKSQIEGVHKQLLLLVQEKVKIMQKAAGRMPERFKPFITTQTQFLTHFEEFIAKIEGNSGEVVDKQQ